MSGTLPHYMKMAAVAVVDLWMGSLLSYFVDKFFKDKFTYGDVTDTSGKWRHDLIAASAQSAVTVLAADQLRALLYPPNFDDPTGGVVFMMSILRQPDLWQKVYYVLEGAMTMLPKALQKEPILEEKPIEPAPYHHGLYGMNMEH